MQKFQERTKSILKYTKEQMYTKEQKVLKRTNVYNVY